MRLKVIAFMLFECDLFHTFFMLFKVKTLFLTCRKKAALYHGLYDGEIKRDLENDYSCDEGGNWLIDFSTDTIYNYIEMCGVKTINANPNTPCSHLSVETIDGTNDNILIYPNPFTGNVNIEITSFNTSTSIIHLLDLNGKEILRKEYFVHQGINTIPIQTIGLKNGIYLITILKDNKLTSHKLIKYED